MKESGVNVIISTHTPEKNTRQVDRQVRGYKLKSCIKLRREKNRLCLKSALPNIKAHDKISFVMINEQERNTYPFIFAAGFFFLAV